MPARLKKGQSNAASQGTDFPELKADALSNLTARIADKLKKPTIGVKTNKNPAKARPEKSERADGEHKKDEGRSGERKQTLANQTSMPAVTAQHGKKRLRDGHVKESRSADTKGNGGKVTFKGDGNGAPSRAQIEEEILALGGSKDDLDLVADVASESELEGDKPSKVPRNDLKKELMRFVQDIGIQTVNYETSESEDAEEEEEEEADITMPEAGITNSAANTPVDREKSTPGPAKVLARGSSGLVRYTVTSHTTWKLIEIHRYLNHSQNGMQFHYLPFLLLRIQLLCRTIRLSAFINTPKNSLIRRISDIVAEMARHQLSSSTRQSCHREPFQIRYRR